MNIRDKIKEAYGEYWDVVEKFVDDYGWCTMINSKNQFVTPTFLQLGMSKKYVEDNIDSGYNPQYCRHRWRPKSIRGIENNNGWIKIESKDDLPSDDVAIDCYFRIDNITYYGLFENNQFHSLYENSFDPNDVSHYKLIDEPTPPIY